MRIGIISGSGTYDWPGMDAAGIRTVETPYGDVELAEGRYGPAEVVHLSRHGRRHACLSNHVQHRAHLAALLQERVDAVIALTLCGAVDPGLEPGSLVVFDDLYFPSNRLPDGALCTWHDTPGAARRGHWIFGAPFSQPLREALIEAGRRRKLPLRTHGCYGHVDGPRFNTRAEICALASAGVSAVSQTGGPETVLAGEAELPLALVGFVTDFANGVVANPEPVDALLARMRASTSVFASLVEEACSSLRTVTSPGIVYRFDG